MGQRPVFGEGQPRAEQPPRGDSGRVRIVLADEQPLVRRGLRALFEGDRSFLVVGEAADGAALLELARQHRPDVVLMDADLPGPDVLDVVRSLCDVEPGNCADVVLLAADGEPTQERALGAIRAGVRGFLYKQDSDGIVSGVRTVTEGGVAVAPSLVVQALAGLRCNCQTTARRTPDELDLLTPRELEIYRLVAKGMTNQQIADVLVLSEATVKSHFNRICRKLSLRNRVDAVILAYEIGVVGALAGRGPAV
ncbi:response regulator transcription factor [Streptomyces sp. NPDC051907]|uniref:response regulator transcription factor n=1 Tax=Streptomyces sp. NPDC051907 TaxID=3155284 RepID=UPI003420517F